MSIIFVLGFDQNPTQDQLKLLNDAIAPLKPTMANEARWRPLSELEAVQNADARHHPISLVMQRFNKGNLLALCDSDRTYECPFFMDSHPVKTGHFGQEIYSFAEEAAEAAAQIDPAFLALVSHEAAPAGGVQYHAETASGFAAWYRFGPWETNELDLSAEPVVVRVRANRPAVFHALKS